MPETEFQMLARLKLMAEPAGVWCEITPEDSAALRYALALLALLARYRGALREASIKLWRHHEMGHIEYMAKGYPECPICSIEMFERFAVLAPDPAVAPAETETEFQMLARLKVIPEPAGLWCEIAPEDSTALRYALALIERYRKALEKIKARADRWLYDESADEDELSTLCHIGQIVDAVLIPDPTPAPAETEATR